MAAVVPKPNWNNRRTAFGDAAADYAYGRPTYPLAAVNWALPLDARRVLDLAAGTGRLTERLIDAGLDVVAVEPSADMRAHIPTAAEVLDGTAEAIPLPDASVDAVVVGHAFHWFDARRAMPEIARVVRPGGTLRLFWNVLDDREEFVDRLAAAIAAEDRLSAWPQDAEPPYRDVPGMAEPLRRTFAHSEAYDIDRLLAYVRSRSQTILLSEDERASLMETVRGLITAGEVRLPFMCVAWRGDRTI